MIAGLLAEDVIIDEVQQSLPAADPSKTCTPGQACTAARVSR